MKLCALLIILSLCFNSRIAQHVENKDFKYKVQKIQLPVDHFNYANNKSFGLRYLYNDSFVEDKINSPIFFYTGNEGDIELFAQNTGFMWELGSKMKASIVFAEHRYYGQSLPFGDATFNSTENIGFLSVEQTLEDYAHLIEFLRGGSDRPVIAFGGSYGGMLAAWLRMKYPHLVLGALAASAPIWQFNGLTECDIYSKITTSVFTTSYSTNCSVNIKNSWDLLKNISQSENGRKYLNTVFNFCDPLKQESDVEKFLDYMEDVFGNLAMANYPYSNDFLMPLPAYPVRQFCLYLKDLHQGQDLIVAMQKAISVYANYTGTSKCLPMSAYDPSLGGLAWEIQTCNQMVMPMCSYLNETMFRNKNWNFPTYSDDCFKKYKIRPKLNDITLRYGGKNLRYASNIIFSNGLLDPWSGGGVLQAINDQIVVIIIPEGAHHLDLRAAHESDPASVIETRKQEAFTISQWLLNFK